MSSTQATRRPFTLIVCPGCGPAEDDPVIERLKGTIRRCAHGMLVSAGAHDGEGIMVLLQPCWPDRSPVGDARWIGPLTDGRDVGELCDWVEQGEWDLASLPTRLRARRTVA